MLVRCRCRCSSNAVDVRGDAILDTRSPRFGGNFVITSAMYRGWPASGGLAVATTRGFARSARRDERDERDDRVDRVKRESALGGLSRADFTRPMGFEIGRSNDAIGMVALAVVGGGVLASAYCVAFRVASRSSCPIERRTWCSSSVADGLSDFVWLVATSIGTYNSDGDSSRIADT